MKTSTKYGLGWVLSIISFILLIFFAPAGTGNILESKQIYELVSITDKNDYLTDYGVFEYYITVQLNNNSIKKVELSEKSYNEIDIGSKINYRYGVIEFNTYNFLLILSLLFLLVIAFVCCLNQLLHLNEENTKDKT